VTLFFGLKCAFFAFSRKQQDGSAPNFFQGLEENTCFLQPALKSIAPGLQSAAQIAQLRKLW